MTTVGAQELGGGRLMGDMYKEDSERDYDEDEEEDGDGEGRGRQMLGFMFGNVDDSGGLDEEYLDQVATKILYLEGSFFPITSRRYGTQGFVQGLSRSIESIVFSLGGVEFAHGFVCLRLSLLAHCLKQLP